jgi:large subunit ribosomal protein L31
VTGFLSYSHLRFRASVTRFIPALHAALKPSKLKGLAPTWRKRMKADLHPPYRKLMVQCACGNQFETRSTATSIHVEVCAQCHPYFTGKQRLVDTAGRVDRFRRRYQTEPATTTPKE